MRLAPLLPLLLLGLLLPSAPASARQTGANAEQRLRQLEAQIARDEALLAQTSEVADATTEQLRVLNRQIAMREELVRSYRDHLFTVRMHQDSLRQSLTAMEEELGELRTEYQARARHAYQYGRLHDLALILSSQSINQMLIRVRYLHRFTQQRRAKLDLVQATSDTLAAQQIRLDSSMVRTSQLLVLAEQEQTNLENQKRERERLIRRLRQQESSLEATLAQNQSEIDRLTEALRNTIATSTGVRSSAADFARLSGSFLQNKGRLPWPADGVVIEPFGEIVNPVHGTVTPNPGILLATAAQAEVKAVFDGTVIKIDQILDLGTTIFIEHGEYQTVYSNFSMTYVAKDQQITAGTVIGRAGTDAEPKGRGVFFGLFQNGREVDPEPWLVSR